MLIVSLPNFVFFYYTFVENCVNFSGGGIIWGVFEMKFEMADNELAQSIKPVQSLEAMQ